MKYPIIEQDGFTLVFQDAGKAEILRQAVVSAEGVVKVGDGAFPDLHLGTDS
ncbi:MAG: hypothetical protein J5I94_25320 [Phaeodactylibacter sp.]|nr:hypothetical protein [Phaeodactylibacter sp.]